MKLLCATPNGSVINHNTDLLFEVLTIHLGFVLFFRLSRFAYINGSVAAITSFLTSLNAASAMKTPTATSPAFTASNSSKKSFIVLLPGLKGCLVDRAISPFRADTELPRENKVQHDMRHGMSYEQKCSFVFLPIFIVDICSGSVGPGGFLDDGHRNRHGGGDKCDPDVFRHIQVSLLNFNSE